MEFKNATSMHHEEIEILSKLATSEDFPHILLYGPSGGGKRTLTKCLEDSTAVHCPLVPHPGRQIGNGKTTSGKVDGTPATSTTHDYDAAE